MIYADYHTHTVMSHGLCTVREVIERAVAAQLSEIAISEHAPSMSYGLRKDDFLQLHEDIKSLSSEYPIKILLGIEANFLGGGKSDIPYGVPFDIILIGYHRSIPLANSFAVSALMQTFTPIQAIEKNTDEVLRTLDNYPDINILVHPNEYIRLNIKRIARYAADRGLLLEINNRHVTLSADDLKLAADEGAHFVIGSDGHTPEEMCRFDKALAVAKEADVLAVVENYKTGLMAYEG